MVVAEIRPLTTLRFFAAAAIVLHHMNGKFGLGTVSLPLSHGVAFFFCLSGFILTCNYPRLRPGEVVGFVVRRFARIWPLHLACFALGWLLVPRAFASTVAAPDGWLVLLANLSMVHAWVPSYRYGFSFNRVSWSISTEWFFYLVFPLLCGSPARRLVGLAAFAALNLVLFSLWGDYLYDPARPVFEQPAIHVYAHLHPGSMIVCFIVGMLAADVFLCLRQARPMSGTAATFMEVAVLLAVAWWLAYGFDALRPQWFNTAENTFYSFASPFLIAPFLLVVFAFSAGWVSRALSWTPLVVLGRVSFAIYMVHQLVLRWANGQAFVRWDGTVAVVGLLVALILGAAFLLHYLVEEPARRLLVTRFRAGFLPSRASSRPA